jgi:hypothetical protein|tara:strand:+ start:209 stop:475 length:267 start_codon:yes stop_codon:yes gene_type:complete
MEVNDRTHFVALTNGGGWAKNECPLQAIKDAVNYSGGDGRQSLKIMLYKTHSSTTVNNYGELESPLDCRPLRLMMVNQQGKVLRKEDW